MKTSTVKRQKKKRCKSRKPVTEICISREKKHGNQLISALHNLNKDLRLIKKDASLSQKERDRKTDELNARITEIGGIEAYQTASLKGEHHHGNFNSAQWVIQKMKEVKLIPPKNGLLKLLDVGALDTVYQKYSRWLDWTAIDLNPQRPNIEKADFLQFKTGCKEEYEVIVMSLVINFSGDPVERGNMLHKARLLTKLNGFLVVVLPLACLSNSRYLSHDLFKEMMLSLGFQTECEHNTKKLSFKMFKKISSIDKIRPFKKKEICKGGGRNNFCIVLR